MKNKVICISVEKEEITPEIALHSRTLKRQNKQIEEYEESFHDRHRTECYIEANRKGTISPDLLRIRDIIDISKTYHPTSLNFLKKSSHGKKFTKSLKNYVEHMCGKSFKNLNTDRFQIRVSKDNTNFLIDLQKTFIEVFPLIQKKQLINTKIPILKDVTINSNTSQTQTIPLLNDDEQIEKAVSLK